MKRIRSQCLFKEAQRLLPGGVNSPVRGFTSVGGTPPFIESARGAYIRDIDGNKYIDYVGSWGPMILGHAHPEIIRAIRESGKRGTSFGAPTTLEVALAKRIIKLYPSIKMVRMVNSGTEAVMSAVRAARAWTGRSMIVKFDGCYHGHADHLLVRAGSGAITLGIPDSKGVPRSFTSATLVARYNDLSSLKKKLLTGKGKMIAAVVVEPVAGNMGVVLPRDGFLEGLRELTLKNDIALIFDEVITGFRLGLGGAQGLYGIRPDMTCLGKILGGGLPVGAYGGKKEIMKMIAPLGPVYQAGTLSGNPLTMSAGLATIDLLTDLLYKKLDSSTEALCNGIKEAARKHAVPITINRAGSMFTIFFGGHTVYDLNTARMCNTNRYSRFFHLLLNQGIYPPSSQFEAWFLSAAHKEKEIEKTISCCWRAFGSL